jgi:collagenase-like PrtC family protease
MIAASIPRPLDYQVVVPDGEPSGLPVLADQTEGSPRRAARLCHTETRTAGAGEKGPPMDNGARTPAEQRPRLVIPAVFDEAFPRTAADLGVTHVYGALPNDPGLRASGWLPDASPEQLAHYVEACEDNGVEFYYALNVACLGNQEFTAEGQRWLVERLGWLVDVGVRGVVLSNPYLVAFATSRFPELHVAVSTAACVDSLDKALFYEAQGANVLYLPEYVNRDFRLLRKIRKGTNCRLVLLANVGCLLHCPLRTYHIELISHSGQSQELGTYVDYPLMWCTSEKANDPGQMLKAPWIRPEDLSVYYELGYDEFKLAGREMDRAWVERAASAYAAGRYDGELNDLILGFDHLEPFGSLPPRFPNRSLDGFIEFFHRKHDCRTGCGECTYCDDWAETTAVHGSNAGAFSGQLVRWLGRFEDGAFRTVSGR